VNITDVATIRQMVLAVLAQPGRHTVGSLRRALPGVSRDRLQFVMDGLTATSVVQRAAGNLHEGTPICLTTAPSRPPIKRLIRPILALMVGRRGESARQIALELDEDLDKVRATLDALVVQERLVVTATIGLLRIYALPCRIVDCPSRSARTTRPAPA